MSVPACLTRRNLQYHAAAGATYSNQLTNGQQIPTLDAPFNLSVTIAAGTVSINSANVTTADVTASNGVLHIINGVLVPPNFALPLLDIVALAQNTSNLSTLVTAVVTAGLVSALQVRSPGGVSQYSQILATLESSLLLQASKTRVDLLLCRLFPCSALPSSACHTPS
jgi:uncharacterized surface protein with fasciclin (FAS1) repeats